MVTVSITGVRPLNVFDATLNEYIVDGFITLSANYGTAASHGDVFDFTSVAPSESFGGQVPNSVDMFEEPVVTAGVSTVATGFEFLYSRGTTQANGQLQILSSTGTEITPGAAYSSQSPSLAAAVIRFKAFFARL